MSRNETGPVGLTFLDKTPSYGMVPVIEGHDDFYLVLQLSISDVLGFQCDLFGGKAQLEGISSLDTAIARLEVESGYLFRFVEDVSGFDWESTRVRENEYFFTLTNIPSKQDIIADFRNNLEQNNNNLETDGIAIFPIFSDAVPQVIRFPDSLEVYTRISAQIKNIRNHFRQRLHQYITFNNLHIVCSAVQRIAFWKSLRLPKFQCLRIEDDGFIRYDLSSRVYPNDPASSHRFKMLARSPRCSVSSASASRYKFLTLRKTASSNDFSIGIQSIGNKTEPKNAEKTFPDTKGIKLFEWQQNSSHLDSVLSALYPIRSVLHKLLPESTYLSDLIKLLEKPNSDDRNQFWSKYAEKVDHQYGVFGFPDNWIEGFGMAAKHVTRFRNGEKDLITEVGENGILHASEYEIHPDQMAQIYNPPSSQNIIFTKFELKPESVEDFDKMSMIYYQKNRFYTVFKLIHTQQDGDWVVCDGMTPRRRIPTNKVPYLTIYVRKKSLDSNPELALQSFVDLTQVSGFTPERLQKLLNDGEKMLLDGKSDEERLKNLLNLRKLGYRPPHLVPLLIHLYENHRKESLLAFLQEQYDGKSDDSLEFGYYLAKMQWESGDVELKKKAYETFKKLSPFNCKATNHLDICDQIYGNQ